MNLFTRVFILIIRSRAVSQLKVLVKSQLWNIRESSSGCCTSIYNDGRSEGVGLLRVRLSMSPISTDGRQDVDSIWMRCNSCTQVIDIAVDWLARLEDLLWSTQAFAVVLSVHHDKLKLSGSSGLRMTEASRSISNTPRYSLLFWYNIALCVSVYANGSVYWVHAMRLLVPGS
jgi:hypothetical protein